MLGIVVYKKNDKSGKILVRELTIPEPDYIEAKIGCVAEFTAWKENYERRLILKKDEMRIVIFPNDYVLKKRRLHVRYYFRVSKYEIKKNREFSIIKRHDDNTLMCAYLVYNFLPSKNDVKFWNDFYDDLKDANHIDDEFDSVHIFKNSRLSKYNQDPDIAPNQIQSRLLNLYMFINSSKHHMLGFAEHDDTNDIDRYGFCNHAFSKIPPIYKNYDIDNMKTAFMLR